LLCVLLFAAASNALGRTAQAWQTFLDGADGLQPGQTFPYMDCFRQAATAERLPLVLLLALARGESDFQPRARSKADAIGIMQIQWPQTARDLGFEHLVELYDPCRNIRAGAGYLRRLLDRYQGDLHLALAAYNYGPGRIPIGAARIPSGAQWYSAYIHRHLEYVLTGPGPGTALADYDGEQQLELIVFDRPYRAEAFTAAMHKRLPGLRLEWYRTPGQGFRVVLLYRGSEELAKARRQLRRAGYKPG
jgi:hypothetical protein